MSEKPNFQEMTRKELRAYVLAYRDDEEAIRCYMDRLHNDPDVFRFRGSYGQVHEEQFKQLIEQQANNHQG
jgi:hypothetical protein